MRTLIPCSVQQESRSLQGREDVNYQWFSILLRLERLVGRLDPSHGHGGIKYVQ